MIRKILYIIQTIVVFFVLGSIITTTYENIDIRMQINKFMEKGALNNEISSSFRKFYKVPRETWQEQKRTFTIKNSRFFPGSSGDIIVTNESPFPGMPIIDEFLTYFVGGHASLCAYEYTDYIEQIKETDAIENTGLVDEGDIAVVETTTNSFWNDIGYKNEYIGLRVNCSEEQRKIAVNQAISYIGDPYNYSFIFNTKKTHYCSDLISKAYAAVGIDLNKDLLAITILDLIVTQHTYISIYRYVDNNEVEHVYYLDDGIN